MRSASTSRVSDPRQLNQHKGIGSETMNELAKTNVRSLSRAVAAPEAHSLPFTGLEGSMPDRPTVYAKISMGEPKRGLRQGAPNQAGLSIDEAKSLRDAIMTAQPGADSMMKTKGCPGLTQDSFTKLSALKTRLENFLSTAKNGNTFPATSDDLNLVDKVLACAIQAQKVPDPWAYVILGGAVAGTVLVMTW